MPEIDLESDYKEKLIYKHSAQGRADRKVASIKRRGKKKYARTGCVAGLVLGVALAVALLIFWGWVALPQPSVTTVDTGHEMRLTIDFDECKLCTAKPISGGREVYVYPCPSSPKR